ncbi:PAS domain-containing protein [Flavobacterium sp. NST-5]|uniref:histidine kinase n=1 Tax=Flavobacterium ichthyis TaxID=2698827 RepID=A0ABW9ZA08_9FLAO|nr:PAS domain-containing protein [Flavobacterium ichthyis]NBL65718.1 PAS domain-containing protein [Flavobacterium ichthyis]
MNGLLLFTNKCTKLIIGVFLMIQIIAGVTVLLIPMSWGFITLRLIIVAILGASWLLFFKFLVNQKKISDFEYYFKKFKILFKKSNLGILQIESQTGKILDCNEKVIEMTGFSEEELKHKNISDIVFQDDNSMSRTEMKKFISGETIEFNTEASYLQKNGAKIVTQVIGSIIETEFGKPKTHMIVLEDISEKIVAENRYRNLFDNAPIALWEEDFSELKNYLHSINLIGKPEQFVRDYLTKNPKILIEAISKVIIINVNNECVKLHHPKTKNELTTSLNAVINDEGMDSFIEQIVGITQGKLSLTINSTLRKSLADVREIQLNWNVIPGFEDTLARVIISTEDVTERKVRENNILHSQQQIETLINSIDGIVWENNLSNLRITFVNKKVEEITGYSVEEWTDEPGFWEKTLHPEDAEYAINYCNTKALTDKQFDFEYRLIAKNGEIIWIRDIVNVVRHNDKPTLLQGIMIDITKSKNAENALNEAFELVSEQNKRLLNFSYIVSHNLRSHTSNIQSIATLIETAETAEESSELIKMLQSVSERLSETIINLNDIVNIQGNTNINLQKLNLRKNIEKTLDILSEKIQEKKAQIIIDVPQDTAVNFNPAYLESVLLNFISNAIRYSHPERLPIICLRCYPKDENIILEIEDNGIGIDLEKYGSKLFGMYKTFHKNADAMGLGLFITKNQIDAMGGKIHVESKPNIGTKFTIYFK